MKETEQSNNFLQTVSRAVAVLRCFEGGARELTLSELTNAMGLNKVTVFRLASTLAQEGLLKQNPNSSAYSISYGLITLGRTLLDPNGLFTLARPAMARAWDSTGETVNLHIREGWDAIVVGAINSKQPMRYVLEVGHQYDLRTGAAGLAILASLDEKLTESILNNPDAVRYSDNTVVHIDAIRSQLQEIKKLGYATSSRQRVKGATGVAAPFFDPRGEVLGSVSIIGPTFRLEETSHRQDCLTAVRKAADFITAELRGS